MSKTGAAREPPEQRIGEADTQRKGRKSRSLPYFRRAVQVDDSSPETDRNRMRTIVSTQLGKYVRDVTFDSRFAEREVVGDQFVGIAGRNQSQDINFALREIILGKVLR